MAEVHLYEPIPRVAAHSSTRSTVSEMWDAKELEGRDWPGDEHRKGLWITPFPDRAALRRYARLRREEVHEQYALTSPTKADAAVLFRLLGHDSLLAPPRDTRRGGFEAALECPVSLERHVRPAAQFLRAQRSFECNTDPPTVVRRNEACGHLFPEDVP